MFFFFQAEDGIRDLTVTGVQTCALPIFVHGEDRDDTGVRELSGGPGFAQEALPFGGLEGPLGREQLDRDPAVEPQLASEVYKPHPAAPQASFQHVAPREGALEIR